ncbi:hypothetical protein GMI69_09310 [Eggerthellaceae bacterium zg-887]|uniref:DUF6541 family protein n=1 Tax=Xiamenia xianingshaonis TaxID=2682776 RepID=UPI00140CA626|nr:DUF6541 family protein [Xiamenia xianingshaonis]NHM16841.1 hypothetical protein [Xiamenia xianingshaonis]
MWPTFFLAALTAAAYAAAPGCLALAAMGLPPLVALGAGTGYTFLLYGVISLACSVAGVPLSAVGLFALGCAPGIVGLAARGLARKGRHRRKRTFGFEPTPLLSLRGRTVGLAGASLAIYVAAGVILATGVFALSLDGPGSFVQKWDNVTHLNLIAAFAGSGDFSLLGGSVYEDLAAQGAAPVQESFSYYPSGWHALAAMAAETVGAPTTLAANAANYALLAFVLPLGCCLLANALFPKRPVVVLAGAAAMLAFGPFPWTLLTWGPLYSNFAAFCTVPGAVALFALGLQDGLCRNARALLFSAFALTAASCVFTQPNALFTEAFLLAPLCVGRACDTPAALGWHGRQARIGAAGFGVGASFVICGIWTALVFAPPLASVVSYEWPATLSLSEAAAAAATLSFPGSGTALLLAALCLVGAVCALRERRLRWLAVSYALALVFYVVSAGTDGALKTVLCGFWYSDAYRIAGLVALAGFPVASLGLAACARFAMHAAERLHASPQGRTAAAAATLAAAAALLYCPNVSLGPLSVPTPFGEVAGTLSWWNDTSRPDSLDADEQAFLQQVQSVAGDGLVVNQPYDGSVFGASTTDVNLYFRSLGDVTSPDSASADSLVIRERLDELAESPDVQRAVDSIGAAYVLQLDQGKPQNPDSNIELYEHGEDWKGIDAITDDTPGFEAVLAEGDRRLYRILPQE